MEEIVRYTYRLRPGAQAERAFLAEWHRCRWLWNEAVHQQRSGCKPTRARLGKLLTAARGRSTWLREGWQNAQANMLNTYADALDRSFRVKGCGKPIIKKRHKVRPSLGLNRNGFAIRDGRLRLPKGVSIPIVWSRRLPSDPTSVRIYQDSLGHRYASFIVRRVVEPAPPAEGAIGIDWGIITPATTTDPDYDLPYAGYRRRCAAELAKAQRKMARRKRPKGHPSSPGYRQARRAKARIEKRAARQTQYAVRIWAKRVVDNHQLIAVEDLRLKFLSASTMARKAADIALGVTRRELVERAVRAGRRVVNIAPAYTSMTCSRCFARTTQRLGLAERTFRCQDCGYVDTRDRNAARTILALAERGQTSVDDVSHASASSHEVAVTVHPELRIPLL